MANPLYKKLGIQADSSILVLNHPKNYIDFFTDFPPNVIIDNYGGDEKTAFIHIFIKTISELEHFYQLAKSNLGTNGMLWISWPKQTSHMKSELNKFDIMKYVLTDDLVDLKVVSIDETWSGLKFVYRIKDR